MLLSDRPSPSVPKVVSRSLVFWLAPSTLRALLLLNTGALQTDYEMFSRLGLTSGRIPEGPIPNTAPGAAAAGMGGEALEPSPWLPSPPRSWPAGGACLPSPWRLGQGGAVSRTPTRGGRSTHKPFDLQLMAEIKQWRPSTSGTLTGPSVWMVARRPAARPRCFASVSIRRRPPPASSGGPSEVCMYVHARLPIE